MFQIPLALLLLFWHGASHFEKLAELSGNPELAAAYRLRLAEAAQIQNPATVGLRLSGLVSTRPEPQQKDEPITQETPTLPNPLIGSERSRDGPSAN